MVKLFILVALATACFSVHSKPYAQWVGASLEGAKCVGGHGVGPWDYLQRENLQRELRIVEDFHFSRKVQFLASGDRGVANDVDYTLRGWPNHHKALLTIIQYQLEFLKNRSKIKYKLEIPPECYLERAINFSPKDPVPYSLYGYYLHKLGLFEKSEIMYKKAVKYFPNNARIAYSYALLLTDLKRYDEALKFSKFAYQHDKPPEMLKNKLLKLGVWKND